MQRLHYCGRQSGAGLNTEAARAALRFAFHERAIDLVIAGTDAPNVASLRVLARLGMRPTHREPGVFGEVVWFELCRADFVE